MPTTLAKPRVKLALLAVSLGSATVLSVTLLPSLARPGPEHPPSDTSFHSVGSDGALPSSAPKLQEPHAPLTTAESGYAIHLARQAMPAEARDVLGNPGGEVLNTELPPLNERAATRRVVVSLYDYATDRLHQTLVDLSTESVVNSREARGLQLPPTVAEASVATQLALEADPAPRFIEQYRSVTGSSLLSIDQLSTVAGVWRDLDQDAGASSPTRVCGKNRCLQLLLALPSGQYLNTTDFTVDLSSRTVLPVRLEGHHEH